MTSRRMADDVLVESGKIVHFLFEPGCGGLDRVAILLANGMAARGVATELWLAKREGLLASLIADNVTVRVVPTVKFGGRGLKLCLQVPALARMIRRHRPSTILSAGNQSNLTVALATKLAQNGHTKAVQKITNPIERPGMGGFKARLRNLRFAATVWLGDLCLTLSEADVRNYTRLLPFGTHRLRAVKNPYVSDGMLEIGQKKLHAPVSATVRFISVGRLEIQKDHATMLRALARLKHLPWELRLLGDGPLENELKELATDLGIAERVTFVGFHPNPGEFLAKSDVLLLSSRWEGLPAVPFEAMACGCDVVTTDCSNGLTDVLGPLRHPKVDVGDHVALSMAIEAKIKDRADVKTMTNLARQYAISPSIDDHLLKIAALNGQSGPFSI